MDSADRLKIILLGPQGAGKTNLIARIDINDHNLFMHESDSFPSTLTPEFVDKNIIVGEHLSVRSRVWDTAGQERFRFMLRPYYKLAHVRNTCSWPVHALFFPP